MKRLRMADYGESEYGENMHMIEDDKGEYVLYSEANALIGDLRRRLEEANGKLRVAQMEPRGYPWERRSGFDERKFN